MTEKKFKIRDVRRRGRYSIDNEYLDRGFAARCGIYATAVYSSLCRHADNGQECYPSIQLMMQQHGISKNSIIKGIKALKNHNIINVVKEYDEKTKRQKNNVYVLMDSSAWSSEISADPSSPHEPGAGFTTRTAPCSPHEPPPVHHKDYKDTHKKDTHKKVASCDAKGDEDEHMDLEQFKAWMSQRPLPSHLSIIVEWADTIHPDMRTKAQWSQFIKANVRAAKDLSVFTYDQFVNATERIKQDMHSAQQRGQPWQPNLETMKKYIMKGKKI